MPDNSQIQKMVRKVRKYESLSKDDSQPSEKRNQAALKSSALQEELISLVFNPHEVQNADIESKRALELFHRKSTDSSNHAKRQRKVDETRIAVGTAMANSANLDDLAKEFISKVMGTLPEKSESEKV